MANNAAFRSQLNAALGGPKSGPPSRPPTSRSAPAAPFLTPNKIQSSSAFQSQLGAALMRGAPPPSISDSATTPATTGTTTARSSYSKYRTSLNESMGGSQSKGMSLTSTDEHTSSEPVDFKALLASKLVTGPPPKILDSEKRIADEVLPLATSSPRKSAVPDLAKHLAASVAQAAATSNLYKHQVDVLEKDERGEYQARELEKKPPVRSNEEYYDEETVDEITVHEVVEYTEVEEIVEEEVIVETSATSRTVPINSTATDPAKSVTLKSPEAAVPPQNDNLNGETDSLDSTAYKRQRCMVYTALIALLVAIPLGAGLYVVFMNRDTPSGTASQAQPRSIQPFTSPTTNATSLPKAPSLPPSAKSPSILSSTGAPSIGKSPGFPSVPVSTLTPSLPINTGAPSTPTPRFPTSSVAPISTGTPNVQTSTGTPSLLITQVPNIPPSTRAPNIATTTPNIPTGLPSTSISLTGTPSVQTSTGAPSLLITQVPNIPPSTRAPNIATTTPNKPTGSPSTSISLTGTPSVQTSTRAPLPNIPPSIRAPTIATLMPTVSPSTSISTGTPNTLSTTSVLPTMNQPITTITNTPTGTPFLDQGTLSPVLLEQLLNLLSSASFDSGTNLRTPGTPQNQAYQWLTSSRNVQDLTDTQKIQRYSLAVFYYSTNGNSWTTNTGWLSNESECIAWYTKSKSNEVCYLNGLLRHLDLSWNGIGGSIPPELGLLSGLQTISLRSNLFRRMMGSLPTTLGALTYLEVFDIYGNNINGTIPSEFGNWVSINTMNMALNLISGSIPSTINGMRQLRQLDLSLNFITGRVPPAIVTLQNLQSLSLNGNQLNGPLTASIAALTSLQSLDLGSNQITALPSQFGGLINLQSLKMNSNQLFGTIPSRINLLSNIEILDLSSNRLSGLIPRELSQLTKLMDLRLQKNNFNGTVPRALCRLFDRTKPQFYTDCGSGGNTTTSKVICSCCTQCF